MTKNIIVADIDGCCLDPEHRIPHFLAGDLDAYHAAWRHDSAIDPGVVIYQMFLARADQYRFLFVTGRPESAREYTISQLQDHVHAGIEHSQLLMRPSHITGADMHDTDLKPMLIELAGYSLRDIFMVFEDRNSIVSMWRSRGITCYQTQLGDY